jgi:hypothetical protein
MVIERSRNRANDKRIYRFEYIQTSGFGRIEAIGATIGVPRDIHVRPNVVGFGISQMAKRTIAEDLGV